jgi:hypothetical protein
MSIRGSRSSQGLGISDEAPAGLTELMSQVVRLSKMLGACIARHTVGGSREERQIVRLAEVGNTVGVGHAGALSRELVEVWRLPAADHVGAVLVLEDHHHDVVGWLHSPLRIGISWS